MEQSSWSPLKSVNIPPEGRVFHELVKNWEARYESSNRYTPYDLDMCKSGIIDASQTLNNHTVYNNDYYNMSHQLYQDCTATQQEILLLYICSGLTQTQINKLKNFQSASSTFFHLEAIRRKAQKRFSPPSETDMTPRIADERTGRYEGESTIDWFNRHMREDY